MLCLFSFSHPYDSRPVLMKLMSARHLTRVMKEQDYLAERQESSVCFQVFFSSTRSLPTFLSGFMEMMNIPAAYRSRDGIQSYSMHV